MNTFIYQSRDVFDYILRLKNDKVFKEAFYPDAIKLVSYAEHGRDMVNKQDETRTKSALMNVERLVLKAPQSDYKEKISTMIAELLG